jgi:C-terminal processing protease CtpA/Prc
MRYESDDGPKMPEFPPPKWKTDVLESRQQLEQEREQQGMTPPQSTEGVASSAASSKTRARQQQRNKSSSLLPRRGTVGVSFFPDDEGRLVVSAVAPYTPAKRAGVRAGEVIVSVDGEMVGGGSPPRVFELLAGKEGTPVVVGIKSAAGTDKMITFLRSALPERRRNTASR